MKRFLRGFLLFVLGVATGLAVAIGVVTWRVRHPPRLADSSLKILALELRLDAAQRARVQPIVERAVERLRGLEQRVHPELEQILKEAEASVRAELRPDQQPRLDRLIERRKRQREQLLR